VHAAAIELADDEAVDLGDGLEQAVGFEIEDQAQPFARGIGGNDERLRQLGEQLAPAASGA